MAKTKTMIQEFENKTGKKFNSKKDLLEYLSEELINNYEYCDDLQESFDMLDDEMDGLLNKYGMVYTMGSEDWHVDHVFKNTVNDKITKALVVGVWNQYYDKCRSRVSNIEDLCSVIENDIIKTMSNGGCDANTALNMICADIYPSFKPFYIHYGEFDPKVRFLLKPLYKRISIDNM